MCKHIYAVVYLSRFLIQERRNFTGWHMFYADLFIFGMNFRN